MSDQTDNVNEQSAAFQKIWQESMSKLMQAAFTFTPNAAPPELLRQIRNGILQALAETWNEFLRSPQFQQGMKHWMDSAVAFRKMSNDFMGKVRREMQAPTRDDMDAIMLSVRHMETRILDRVEELAKQISEPNQRSGTARSRKARSKARIPNRRRAKSSPKHGRGNKKAGTS
jgi:hypothetical protein